MREGREEVGDRWRTEGKRGRGRGWKMSKEGSERGGRGREL